MKEFFKDLGTFYKEYFAAGGRFLKKHWRGSIVMTVVVYGIAFLISWGPYLKYRIEKKIIRKDEESEED